MEPKGVGGSGTHKVIAIHLTKPLFYSYCRSKSETLTIHCAQYWVLVKVLNSSYHSMETILFTIDPYYSKPNYIA